MLKIKNVSACRKSPEIKFLHADRLREMKLNLPFGNSLAYKGTVELQKVKTTTSQLIFINMADIYQNICQNPASKNRNRVFL